MKAVGYGERLVQITRYPGLFPVSVYLVGEDDGFTLIDTGLKGRKREILEVVGRYGGQVRHLALTHAHADHTGSLDAQRETLRALEPSRLAAGHGPVLEDPLPAIDRAIEVAGRKVGDRSQRVARGVA
jgi:glyoxylase-like metal-dependent hydrolase (beta-lactamase superfamily II)